MTIHRRWSGHEPHGRLVVIAVVSLASCRAEPEVMALSAEPAEPAARIPKEVASVDEELSRDDHPRFFQPIPLAEAPREWPRWSSKEPPPPDVLGLALAKIAELEEGLTPVAKPEDIPWGARQVAYRYDMLFAPAARTQDAADLKMSWRRHPKYEESSTIGRTWPFEIDGGRVVVSVCEDKGHMAVRLRPDEWTGRSIDERLAWARWAVPRVVRIRGRDNGKDRPDIDLRFRRIDNAQARLTTATWSLYPPKWFMEVAGTVGDGGVALLFHRWYGYEQGY
jgi:hypothetical protein